MRQKGNSAPFPFEESNAWIDSQAQIDIRFSLVERVLHCFKEKEIRHARYISSPGREVEHIESIVPWPEFEDVERNKFSLPVPRLKQDGRRCGREVGRQSLKDETSGPVNGVGLKELLHELWVLGGKGRGRLHGEVPVCALDHVPQFLRKRDSREEKCL